MPRKPATPAPPEQIARIKAAQELIKLTNADLASLVGCSGAAASKWFGDPSNLTEPRANELEQAIVDYAADAQTTYVMVLDLLQGQPVKWANDPANKKAVNHG